MTDSSGSGVVGQQGLNSDASNFNMADFQIDQALGKIGTIKVVKVMGVKNAGELSAVGFVDIQPMVNLVDGVLGGAMPHGTIFNVPYCRLQGGKNAIIIDPVVGDIGLAVIADRDISAVKDNKDFSPPGSFRRFNPADSVYIGGILNGIPEQYIQFNDQGVTIGDKNGNKFESKADGFHFNKPVFINGGLNLAGTIQALDGASTYAGNIKTSGLVQSGNVSLSSHVHGGVQPGGSNTGGPT